MALEDDTGQLGAVQMQRLQKDNQRNCRTGSNWINLGFSNFSLEASSFAPASSQPTPRSSSLSYGDGLLASGIQHDFPTSGHLYLLFPTA